MKRLFSILLCFCLLISLFGCSVSKTVGPEISEEEIFTLLFDLANKIEIQLDMSKSELLKMQQDYDAYDRQGAKSPIYRMGDLRLTITTPDNIIYTYSIPEVGVRMKGNTSRTDFYNPKEGIYNIIHLKISFQETFDDPQFYGDNAKVWTDQARNERKMRTFASLEKLDLRWNRCDDDTYLREYFAYETYRKFGVLAPHTNLASFDWAGIHMGVFTINEPVDEAFLQKNLPPEALGGDLYKIGWAGNENGSFTSTASIGIEDEATGRFYAFDLKTNKKSSSHLSLTQLIHYFNGTQVTKEDFAKQVDLDQFIPFCAVSYLLGNPDDLRNNYNNTYLYFRKDNGKAILIPYDYDRCMGITTHWNPTGDALTTDSPFSDRLNATNELQQNPLFLYSVCTGGYFINEYAQMLRKIMDHKWFTAEQFEALYQTAKIHYGKLTKPGKYFYNTEGLRLQFQIGHTSDFSSNDNISIQDYLSAKRKTLAHYLEIVDQFENDNPNVPAQWYIRCDHSNWQNDRNFAMREDNGQIQIHLVINKQIRLKVYHNTTGRWYGSECIDPNYTVPYTTDDHTNIILEPGTYLITFHPTSELITISFA